MRRPLPEEVIVCNARSLAVCGADFLAGWGADDDIRQESEVGAEPIGCEFADIGVHSAAGMAGGKNGPPPGVKLAGRDGAEPGPTEAEAPSTACSAKKVQNIHGAFGTVCHSTSNSALTV